MKRFFLFICIFSFFSGSVFSQSNQEAINQTFLSDFVRKNWTTADGLPGMTITTMMQDKKGYIWLGSYDGLVRFDGVEFTTYNRTIDEKYDFASARSIIQDVHGNLWVGHNDEGVTCLRANGDIVKFTVDNGLPNNKINVMCEDGEENIWIGTSSGLCYITPENKIVVPDGLAELGQEKILVARLFCDNDENVWIITGLQGENFIYDHNAEKVVRFDGFKQIKDPAIFGVTQEEDGTYWFGVSPHYAVKLKDGQERVYDVSHEGLHGTVVNAMTIDAEGNYWFGTDTGITIMHGNKFVYYDSKNGLVDNGITKLFKDSEGNVWIGFNRGGLQKMSKGKFRTVQMPFSVNAICEDPIRGVTWLGADNGVYCYKNNGFIENEITELCKNLRIRHVGMTSDGELLISSYSEKSQICISSDGKVKIWSEEDGLPIMKCRLAIKISNGDYYIATPQGLSIVHHEDGHISTLTRADGFSNHYIMWVLEDSKKRVWVGTNGGGVFVLENEKILKHYNTENGLAGNVIFKILEIKNEIWIGTGTGLSKYIEDSDSFVNFNSRTGLGTDGVFQIICDRQDNIWLTSNKGICSVPFEEINEVIEGKKKRVSVRYYGDSDGLITSGVTSTSLSAIDSRGRVWFTLTDGFALYDPAKAATNKFAPKIEIQDYVIDNAKFDYHGEKILLSPSTKRLSIKFTGLSFISSDSMRFRYKLTGFENEYTDWADSRAVSYTNLKPGTYYFTVMSQNSDGVQSEPSIPITIEKQPYIWQQPWFWILLAALALAAVWRKIYTMRRYQIVLEQKVEERTHELKLEKEKSESLLLNILPADVAVELTNHPGETIAKKYPNVAVLFTDIVGFTKMSDKMTAEEVVTMLNMMISRFDDRAKKEGIEKIKTIGDAYMAACGLTEEAENGGAAKMVRFAQGLIEDINAFNKEYKVNVQIRLGINTGNLVAGVIGKTKFIYDIWGDTVNVASRMESTGEPMKIHVTESTFAQTKDLFSYSEGVEIQVKGKGEMKTYFL